MMRTLAELHDQIKETSGISKKPLVIFLADQSNIHAPDFGRGPVIYFQFLQGVTGWIHFFPKVDKVMIYDMTELLEVVKSGIPYEPIVLSMNNSIIQGGRLGKLLSEYLADDQ